MRVPSIVVRGLRLIFLLAVVVLPVPVVLFPVIERAFRRNLPAEVLKKK